MLSFLPFLLFLVVVLAATIPGIGLGCLICAAGYWIAPNSQVRNVEVSSFKYETVETHIRLSRFQAPIECLSILLSVFVIVAYCWALAIVFEQFM